MKFEEYRALSENIAEDLKEKLTNLPQMIKSLPEPRKKEINDFVNKYLCCHLTVFGDEFGLWYLRPSINDNELTFEKLDLSLEEVEEEITAWSIADCIDNGDCDIDLLKLGIIVSALYENVNK